MNLRKSQESTGFDILRHPMVSWLKKHCGPWLRPRGACIDTSRIPGRETSWMTCCWIHCWMFFTNWLVVWLPFFIFPYIRNVIIPIDTLIRGVAQPPTSQPFSNIRWPRWPQMTNRLVGNYFSMEHPRGAATCLTEALYKLQSVLVPLTLAIGFAQLFQPVPRRWNMHFFFLKH